MKSDKELECERYENRALSALKENLDLPVGRSLEVLGPALRAPYLCYQRQIRNCLASPKMKALEIGAGTGMFTEMILETGASVVATDISEASLELLLKRVSNYANVETRVADMESLPFDDGSFDAVLSAGSLSYGDNEVVMNEIYRVLKPGGKFACVDSLNHNPIYRLNRWIRYLRNQRTRSTIERMPTLQLVKSYAQKFGSVKDSYFGSVAWALPLLTIFLSEQNAARFSDKIDELFDVSKSAFKFVMVAEKNR